MGIDVILDRIESIIPIRPWHRFTLATILEEYAEECREEAVNETWEAAYENLKEFEERCRAESAEETWKAAYKTIDIEMYHLKREISSYDTVCDICKDKIIWLVMSHCYNLTGTNMLEATSEPLSDE